MISISLGIAAIRVPERGKLCNKWKIDRVGAMRLRDLQRGKHTQIPQTLEDLNH